MPSPIAHAAMGLAIYEVARHSLPDMDEKKISGTVSGLLVVTMGFSLLPDSDVIPAVLSGNFAAFHNNFTHSPFFGLMMTALFAGVMLFIDRRNVMRWAAIAFGAYLVHIGMDFFTPGRGVMLMWPFLPDRFEPSFVAFYGVHWSEPVTSIRHLWTVITEGLFVLLMGTGALAYRHAARSVAA